MPRNTLDPSQENGLKPRTKKLKSMKNTYIIPEVLSFKQNNYYFVSYNNTYSPDFS